MRPVPLPYLLAALACAGSLLATHAHADSPTLRFETDAVVAEGVQPGGRLAWLGGGHALENAVTVSFHDAHRSADDDQDGEVRWDLELPVPAYSTWLAVDLETGELAAGSPDASDDRRVDFPTWRLAEGPARGVGRLDLETLGRFRVLVVRPGEGAWSAVGSDGSNLDDDATFDGVLRLAIDRLHPVGDTRDAVDHLRAGDVLALLHLDQLTVAVHTVTAEDLVGQAGGAS